MARPSCRGPGSNNVLTGNLPALRAMSPAAAAAFVELLAKIAVHVQELSTGLGTPPPAGPAAVAHATKELDKLTPAAEAMIASIDQIICPIPLLKIGGPPNGAGVIIAGSTTVLINNFPAGRALDQIREIMALDPNMVAVGFPTVQIGG
jgi:uncharacterized Zn-binding protein involved in type VI secretion